MRLISHLNVRRLRRSRIKRLLNAQVVRLCSRRVILLINCLRLILVILTVMRITSSRDHTVTLRRPHRMFRNASSVNALALKVGIRRLAGSMRSVLTSLLKESVFLCSIKGRSSACLIIILSNARNGNYDCLNDRITLRLTRNARVRQATRVRRRRRNGLSLFFGSLSRETVRTDHRVPISISRIITVLVFTRLNGNRSPALRNEVVLTNRSILTRSTDLSLSLPGFLWSVLYVRLGLL